MGNPIQNKPNLVQILTYYDPNPDTFEHPMNVMWALFNASITPTVSQLQVVANCVDEYFATVWADWGAVAKHYLGCKVTDFSSPFGASYSSVGVGTPIHGLSGAVLPAQVAGLISLHGNERWKGGHSRIYLPWGSLASVQSGDPDLLTATMLTELTTDFNNWWNALQALSVGAGLKQVIYRQRTDPVHAHLLPATSFTVQPMVATQRRRLRKVPHH